MRVVTLVTVAPMGDYSRSDIDDDAAYERERVGPADTHARARPTRTVARREVRSTGQMAAARTTQTSGRFLWISLHVFPASGEAQTAPLRPPK